MADDSASSSTLRKRRKRGHYRQYLFPNSQASVPKSTRYRKQQDAAIIPPQGSHAGGDDETTGNLLNEDCRSVLEQQDIPETAVDYLTATDFIEDCSLSLHLHTDDEDSSAEDSSEIEGGSFPGLHTGDQEDGTSPTEQEINSPQVTATNSLAELFDDLVTQRVVVSSGDILLMVLKYACKNNLTFTGLSNLIKLVNSIFHSPVLPESRYHIDKMVCSKAGGAVSFHYYCTSCYHYVGELSDKASFFECPECKQKCKLSSVAEAPFFVTFDIRRQLQRVLQSDDFVDLTHHYPDSDSLRDMQDGKMYKEFVAATAQAGHRISLTLNIDGVPIFKSSSTAIWPIQLTVNELPAEKRMKKCVLAALWFGQGKPRMDIFQKAFVDIMNDLSENGFEVQYHGQETVFRAFCICCAVDSVARAPMQGVSQFNGYFGCNWCLHPGKYAGGSMRYPVEEVDSPERTEAQMIEDMQTAYTSGTTIRGVKTISPLLSLAHFNIVWGFVPDFMHSMLLGIGRQFLEYWLEGTGAPYYIGRSLPMLDMKLLGITPPQEVGRLPRSLKDRRFWKASELQNWILYYSIPVLERILSETYLKHWALLVVSLHAMMQTSVSKDNIDATERLLLTFVVKTQHLYGETAMTFNVHQLVHMSKSVRLWGPLWAHSSFPFECGNGEIKACIKAANGIPQQVCRTLAIHALADQLQDLTVNGSATKYCTELDQQFTRKTTAVRSEEVRFFGRPRAFVPSCPLLRDNFSADSVQYNRALIAKTLYTTSAYALDKNRRNNNSVVKLSNGSYGIIDHLVLENDCSFAVIRLLKCRPSDYCSMPDSFIVEVTGEAVLPIVVRTTSICSPCVFVKRSKTYVIAVPKVLLY